MRNTNKRDKMKLFFLMMLFTVNAFAGAMSDCTKEDQCKYDDCATYVIEEVKNISVMPRCKEVYKLRNGKHEYAYKEISLMVQVNDGKKPIMSGTTIRVP